MNEDYLPISLIAHTAFCHRRAWLEAAGEQADSSQIQEGHSDHKRVDKAIGAKADEYRSVPVWNDELRVTGVCDVVRGEEGKLLRVIEFKATPVRLQSVVTDAMRTQLAIQLMCLQDMGHETAGAAVFFTTHHRRVDVDLTTYEHCSSSPILAQFANRMSPHPRSSTTRSV